MVLWSYALFSTIFLSSQKLSHWQLLWHQAPPCSAPRIQASFLHHFICQIPSFWCLSSWAHSSLSSSFLAASLLHLLPKPSLDDSSQLQLLSSFDQHSYMLGQSDDTHRTAWRRWCSICSIIGIECLRSLPRRWALSLFLSFGRTVLCNTIHETNTFYLLPNIQIRNPFWRRPFSEQQPLSWIQIGRFHKSHLLLLPHPWGLSRSTCFLCLFRRIGRGLHLFKFL